MRRPTYATMLNLYNNYVAAAQTPETVTPQEIAEENAFMNAIFSTDVMRKTYQFLRARGTTPPPINISIRFYQHPVKDCRINRSLIPEASIDKFVIHNIKSYLIQLEVKLNLKLGINYYDAPSRICKEILACVHGIAINFAKLLGEITGSMADFKRLVKELWFGMYPRVTGRVGSSGFEHVFLGELKNGVSGLHSWLRYYLEERSGSMNYLGYIRTRSIGQVKLSIVSSDVNVKGGCLEALIVDS